MNFRFIDLTAPLADRFNHAVKLFIEEIKKHLAVSSIQSLYPEYDQNGFIRKVVLVRYSGELKRCIEIYPSVDGKFDYKCILPSGEIEKERKEVTLTTFYLFSKEDEEGIGAMKKFFQITAQVVQ